MHLKYNIHEYKLVKMKHYCIKLIILVPNFIFLVVKN
jgi:hypothetical protein